MKRLLPLSITIGLLLSLTPLLITPASAQTPQSGISITPPVQRLSLEADQQLHRSTIIITNHNDHEVRLNISLKDFGNLEQGGGLVFLGTTPDDTWDNHRLSEWLTVSPQVFNIPAKSQQELQVLVNNNSQLTPGGHYAAVIASLEAPDNDISINQSLSSLLFVNKQGGEVYNIAFKELAPKSEWWGVVEGASIRFSNQGNTHLVPRGQVELKNPLGQSISKGIINQQSGLLMPYDTHDYQVELNSLQPAWWPGNYTIVLSYRYDGSDDQVIQHRTVFSLGIAGIAGICLLSTTAIAFGINRFLHRHHHNN